MARGNTKITFVALHPDVELPSLGTRYATGFDLRVHGDHLIMPGETKVLPTGLALADLLPPELDLQVRPRSSTPLKHGLIVSNSPGTIDADYTKEIGIVVTRLFTFHDLLPVFDTVVDANGREVSLLAGLDPALPTRIEHGTRLAQLVFCEFVRPQLRWGVANAAREERAGFGSTGQ